MSEATHRTNRNENMSREEDIDQCTDMESGTAHEDASDDAREDALTETISRVDAIEALLFAHAEPLAIRRIAQLLRTTAAKLRADIDALRDRYAESGGLTLIEAGGELQLATKKEFHAIIAQLFQSTKKRGLSNASMEVLTIVAMRQPITKAEIEQIRGVSSDGAVQSLLSKGLIEVSGRLDKIGKPQVFSTTPTFLRVFGFKSLDELPSMSEIELFE